MLPSNVLGYLFMVLFPVFQFGCYGILQRMKDDIVIRKRDVKMIYVSTVAAWLAYINLLNSLFGGIPCAVHHIFTISIPPLSIGTQLLRGIRLWGMLERHKILSESYGNNTNNSFDDAEANGPLTAIQEVDSSKGEQSQMSDIHMHVRKNSNLNEKVLLVKIKVSRLVGLVRLLLIVLPLILMLGLLVTNDSKKLGERKFVECFPEPDLILNGGRAITGLLSLGAFCTTIFMSQCHDELGIRKEIIRNIVILFITNLISFLLRYLDLTYWYGFVVVVQQMILSASMTIIPCFSNTSVINWMKSKSKRLIPGYARPIPQLPASRGSILLPGKKLSQIKLDENSKREREATMSLDAGLCILLSSNAGIETFTEHCSREFSVENVKFWLEVNEFHKAADIIQQAKEINCQNEKDLLTFGREIFNTFIEDGSDMQINISEAQSISIRQRLESDDTIKRDLFDNAQKEVYSLMSRHSYPRFLSSKSATSYKTRLEKKDVVKRFSRRNSTVLPT